MSKLDDFGKDTVHRCRWALAHNDGHPLSAWSTGERLAVALVLFDRGHLKSMDYTQEEAAQRVSGGLCDPPTDFGAWLQAIRAELQKTSIRKGVKR